MCKGLCNVDPERWEGGSSCCGRADASKREAAFDACVGDEVADDELLTSVESAFGAPVAVPRGS